MVYQKRPQLSGDTSLRGKALSEKMPTSLQEASSDIARWSLTGHRVGQVVTACDLRFDGAWPQIQLALTKEMGSISIPFDPASFKDDLPRKGISFNIPETARHQIEKIEERVKTLLSATWPSAQRHSALKVSERYPTSLRCKIRVRGPRACRCYDAQLNPREMPYEGQWEGLQRIPIISFGAYVGEGQAGLLLDVQALMIGERIYTQPPDFTFLMD